MATALEELHDASIKGPLFPSGVLHRFSGGKHSKGRRRARISGTGQGNCQSANPDAKAPDPDPWATPPNLPQHPFPSRYSPQPDGESVLGRDIEAKVSREAGKRPEGGSKETR